MKKQSGCAIVTDVIKNRILMMSGSYRGNWMEDRRLIFFIYTGSKRAASGRGAVSSGQAS